MGGYECNGLVWVDLSFVDDRFFFVLIFYFGGGCNCFDFVGL